MTMTTCTHCMFMAMAKRFREEGEKLNAEGLSCLGSPKLSIALELENTACGEALVCQGAKPKEMSKWLKRLMDL